MVRIYLICILTDENFDLMNEDQTDSGHDDIQSI